MSDIRKRAFSFALRIIKLARFIDKNEPSARILARQILKSGTSIGANIEEGQAAESKADFIHKYNISLKEAREVLYWLRLIKESEIVKEDKISDLIKEASEITKIIGKIIVNTKNGK